MNLQPWDLWEKDGTPKHDTTEIVRLLEDALARHPEHPGLNHLYVHAMEASSTPEKAQVAADRLRHLVPDAGHLVHMPAHIDLRLGHYQLASEANERAMAADARQAETFPKAGFYRVYMAHNSHFLAFSSMMEGRSAAALAAARRMVADVPREFIDDHGPMVDGLMPVVFHALVRFGRWEEILREPAFPEQLITANATRCYARGVALTALGRTDDAEIELDELNRLAVTLDDRVIGINKAKDVMQIATLVLSGELAFRRGERDRGLELLAKAAADEDALTYMEPPDWMMPVRHAWGAALLEASEWHTAERVFREDLARFPENGWSLFGLARALRGQGRESEARVADERFRKAWTRADVTLESPCFCQPGTRLQALARR
jgi:tetratricopeptide (TPR) repeat protein